METLYIEIQNAYQLSAYFIKKKPEQLQHSGNRVLMGLLCKVGIDRLTSSNETSFKKETSFLDLVSCYQNHVN
jgi:hypothetical protein